MDIRPLYDRIVIRRLEATEETVGGIIVPDSAREKPQRGTVLAVGRGRLDDEGQRIPLEVKPGDLVLFGKYTSQEITVHGEDVLIIREDEVLAVIDAPLPARSTD
jgi:chaperonin GroES